MTRSRRLSALLLSVGALAVSASITLAAGSSFGLSKATGVAAAAAGAGLAIASSAAAQAAAAGSEVSATDAQAEAWAAANAGLDKAVNAINSNSTDADAGGLDGISTARDAITAGLAHAGDAAGNASDHPTGH